MWTNDTNTPLQIRGFTNSFIHTIREHKIYFENFQQNDAEEFITLLLDRIHEVLKKTLHTKGPLKQINRGILPFIKITRLLKNIFIHKVKFKRCVPAVIIKQPVMNPL